MKKTRGMSNAYHKLIIEEEFIKKYFCELFFGHHCRNRYLMPNETLKNKIKKVGKSTNFAIIGYNDENALRKRDKNNAYVMTDELDIYGTGAAGAFEVTEDMMNGTWMRDNNIYLCINRGERMHRMVLRRSGENISNKVVHHRGNTFDNRLKNLEALSVSRHAQIHRSQGRRGNWYCVNDIKDLLKIL